MNETMPQSHYDASDQKPDDFELWEQELAKTDWSASENLDEAQIEQLDTDSLERQVLANPEEPQTAWIESTNGMPTEAEYRQQCYWVIGQFGHALDVLKDEITTDEQAEEWLEMKMTIAAAKSETDPYALMSIRSTMIPIWNDYIERMNIDWSKFEQVANK